MKTICLSLLSIGLFSTSLSAEEPLESRLVISKICANLGEKVDFMNQPHGYKEGVTLTYQITDTGLVSIDKESLNLNGWELNDRPKISKDGSTAYFSIYNKFYQGNLDEIKLDGSLVVELGAEPINKEITLKKGDDPVKLPDFTVQLPEKREGIRIKGKLAMMKSIKVENDGKELRSNGYSSSGDDISYYYKDLNKNSKITITYWSKIKKKTVKITK